MAQKRERRAARPGKAYLRTAEVARVLGVSPKTVARWAEQNALPYMRTLGGHRRFPVAEIEALAASLASGFERPHG